MKIRAHPPLAHQPVHDGQHLPLHRHVQRRGRLVGDQHLGVGHQHHGDHDALPHPARHLVRIGAHHAFGILDGHRAQHVQRGLPRLARAALRVQRPGLRDLRAHPHGGVQRELGILHHHGDVAAPDGAHPRLGQGQQVRAVEGDAAGLHLPRRADQAQDGPARHRLARPALAHDAQALAPQGEGHAAHRLEQSLARGEADVEVLHLQERRGHAGTRLRASGGRSCQSVIAVLSPVRKPSAA